MFVEVKMLDDRYGIGRAFVKADEIERVYEIGPSNGKLVTHIKFRNGNVLMVDEPVDALIKRIW